MLNWRRRELVPDIRDMVAARDALCYLLGGGSAWAEHVFLGSGDWGVERDSIGVTLSLYIYINLY